MGNKICKMFTCHSDCTLNDEIQKIQKTIKSLKLEDLEDLYEFHKYKQQVLLEKQSELKPRISESYINNKLTEI